MHFAMFSLRAALALCCVAASSAFILDFEGYSKGDVLSDLGNGVTLSAKKKENGSWKTGQAMIFDSSNPSGDDWDLGTPNEKFGGPGKGIGGESGLYKNDKPLGNVVIVSEDEDASDPDDNIGGILIFDFASPMRLGDVGLLDHEEGAVFTATLVDGSTRTLTMGTGGDNAHEVVTFADKGLPGVTKLELKMHGSGAISFVQFIPADQTPVPSTKSGVCSERLIKTKFLDGTSGFVYADDAFRATNSAGYSHGFYDHDGGKNNDGALEISVGGKDGSQIHKMSGGFSKSFNLEMETDVKLRFNFRLYMACAYEDDETTEVLVSVDGVLYGLNGNEYVARKHGGGVIDYHYTEIDLGLLAAGSHTLTIGLYNNKKTESKENASLVVDEVDLTQTCLSADTRSSPGTCSENLVDTKFLAGSSGFAYSDDVFRGTSSPGYSHGSYEQTKGENNDGALVIIVGGIDTANIHNISGGFSKTFNLEMETDVKLRFKFYLHMENAYEDDEVSEVLVSVDGTLHGLNDKTFVAQKSGGGVIDYNYAEVDFGLLPSGSHKLAIGLYNNKKTYHDEVTTLVIDEVKLVQTCLTSSPTKAPTTRGPTPSPTKAPTTRGPTTSPTKAPTTRGPTTSPTKAPTTRGPTPSPTKAPTTRGPTPSPTKAPTTRGPTSSPTKAPTTRGPTPSPTNVRVPGDVRTGVKLTRPPTSSPTPSSKDNCIATNWNADGNDEELICSSKKAFVKTASTPVPVTCAKGDKVKLSVDAMIHFPEAATAPLYDVAWYVATDGGDALEGTCQLTPLGKDKFASAALLSSGANQIGSIVWDAKSDGDGDQCGDVVVAAAEGSETGANLNVPLVKELELPCSDEDEDGLIDFAVCFTWRLDCNNDVCSFGAVIPGHHNTGCYCTRVDVTNTQVEDPNPIKPCR